MPPLSAPSPGTLAYATSYCRPPKLTVDAFGERPLGGKRHAFADVHRRSAMINAKGDQGHVRDNGWYEPEILRDAVRFQEQMFGVNSLQSTTEPERFDCDRTFDCIFVASLFTHLPEATFFRRYRETFAS